jgi:hypothetical protein
MYVRVLGIGAGGGGALPLLREMLAAWRSLAAGEMDDCAGSTRRWVRLVVLVAFARTEVMKLRGGVKQDCGFTS